MRKINKAIYLLLERYHRLYGLRLASFSGGHGYGYGMFYTSAVSPIGEKGWQFDYDDALGEKGKRQEKLSLVAYICDVGLPAWTNGRQAHLKDWRSRRTSDIVEWLEANLSLRQLFTVFAEEIDRWRGQYSVEQSEKYLLTMNLAGLHCAESDSILYNHIALFSDYDSNASQKIQNIEDRLEITRSFGDIWGSDALLFATNGLALAKQQEVVDVWDMYRAGLNAQGILNKIRPLTQ
jgi:hypothetical protein